METIGRNGGMGVAVGEAAREDVALDGRGRPPQLVNTPPTSRSTAATESSARGTVESRLGGVGLEDAAGRVI
jgi:hypothetical protein